jgi:hypothetical protein
MIVTSILQHLLTSQDALLTGMMHLQQHTLGADHAATTVAATILDVTLG